ncbi:(2Fe-2S)-binding protein [Streptomyces mayteni]
MTVPAFASATHSTTAAATPLTPAFARIGEAMPTLQIVEEEPTGGAGWVLGSELAAGGAAFEAFLARDERQILETYGQPGRPDVVAAFALHRYAWPAAALFVVPYFLLRRVPMLAPEDVAFQRDEGRLAVRTGVFSCLPDDPAAGDPAARVVPDEEALRAAVREATAAHLDPILTTFGPRMRRRRRALWGVATDEMVEALWYLGHQFGEEERAIEEAGLLLPGSTAPYSGGASFRELTGPAGEALTTRDRASCCMFYTLRPQDTCVTCPRTCDEERVTRLAPSR